MSCPFWLQSLCRRPVASLLLNECPATAAAAAAPCPILTLLHHAVALTWLPAWLLKLLQCEISPKKSAGLVRKVLLSARANATNNLGLDESRLRVGEPPLLP